jgi:hypothetical protein
VKKINLLFLVRDMKVKLKRAELGPKRMLKDSKLKTLKIKKAQFLKAFFIEVESLYNIIKLKHDKRFLQQSPAKIRIKPTGTAGTVRIISNKQKLIIFRSIRPISSSQNPQI